jgi:hypothetical protein
VAVGAQAKSRAGALKGASLDLRHCHALMRARCHLRCMKTEGGDVAAKAGHEGTWCRKFQRDYCDPKATERYVDRQGELGFGTISGCCEMSTDSGRRPDRDDCRSGPMSRKVCGPARTIHSTQPLPSLMGPIPGPPRQKKKSKKCVEIPRPLPYSKVRRLAEKQQIEDLEQSTLEFRAWYFYRNPRVIIDKFRLPQMT